MSGSASGHAATVYTRTTRRSEKLDRMSGILLSRLMEAEGTEVDWAMITRPHDNFPTQQCYAGRSTWPCAKYGASGSPWASS